MATLLVIGLVLAAWAAFLWVCIWADGKDQNAHDAWMNSPDRIWNQWKRDGDE